MFFGRKKELGLLEDSHRSETGEIVVVYGRRRVGKSTLIKKFAEKKDGFLCFEGIEGKRTPDQIRHFTHMLKTQTNDPVLESITFKSWDTVCEIKHRNKEISTGVIADMQKK